MKRNHINCFDCTYFYITWDEKFPRGCRLMDFKSKQMPSVVVFRSSGEQCLYFKPKMKKRG